MTEDFYDLLEIPPDASQDEIKDAYREQVRVYHPDLNDDDRAQAQFTAVKTAYDILGDPVERQAYDRLGHEDYVAKRTSGLPSPDVWQSDDEAADDSSGTELSYSESETASASASTASSAAGSATSGSSTASRSSAGTSSTAGAASASAGTATGTSSAGGTGSGSRTSTAGRTGSGTNGGTGGASGPTGSGSGRASGTSTRSETDAGTGNPLARWWRRQNFSLPLLWLSVLVYAAGLGHFGLENAAALGSLRADLRATGGEPAGLWTLLSESRHGLESPIAFVRGVEFVAPPLEPTLWYGVLAGIVAIALGGLLVVRTVTREDTWGPVTIDETIVVALALTTATTLVGGPLLAGAVLMPLLFGVVVRHTRRGPGWKPSYLYLLPVLAPLAGFAVAAAGYGSLPVDLAVFVILPTVGGLGLPLRATIRKQFGW
ncbi:J domain-containing protein [Natrinema salaciae]|uniref:DnaJ domain-containing protein n=1 Tax=Natrinema salaciae TaxID=1186196 RepID=A0A1H9BJL0_9EURY|nr:J domain-containing protein [Natrinema salaciae]SEP89180.1 DnaJ domain-containing protein [Natrinema salaciae]